MDGGLHRPISEWTFGIVYLKLWVLNLRLPAHPRCCCQAWVRGNVQNQMTQEVLSQLQIISAQQSKIGGSRDKLRMFGKVRLHSACALTPGMLIINICRHIGLVRLRDWSPSSADPHGCTSVPAISTPPSAG